MTAFDTVWSLIKADQDFYIGAKRLPSGGFDWDANRLDLAQKRAWLYNEPIPQTLDEADEKMWTDGWVETTLAQANTGHGHHPQIDHWTGLPKRDYFTDEIMLDYDNPIRGPGRVLYNLPEIWNSVKNEQERQWKKSDEGKKEKEAWRRNPRLPFPIGPEPTDEQLIDKIIETINHEIGHTTQPAEEEEWEEQARRRGGLWNWQRPIFMAESLASIYENPHDLNWRKKIANYGGMDMRDYHDSMRELSHGMAKFFESNPEVYRSPEKVKAERQKIEEILARYRD